MYSIAYENQDIVIRLNKDSIDKKILSGFLEYFEMEKSRAKSRLTRTQALNISKEINRNVWNQLKDRVLGENNCRQNTGFFNFTGKKT